MSLSVPEQRRLAEIERGLAQDATLVALAERVARCKPRSRRRPLADRPMWLLAALLAAVGAALLIVGVTTGSGAGEAIGVGFAVLLCAPLAVIWGPVLCPSPG